MYLSTLNTYLKAQILACFTLRPAVIKIQGCRKSENPKCTEWPLILNIYQTKVPCIHYILAQKAKILVRSLYDQPFSRDQLII